MQRALRSMTVAGVMSGTSADGIDVAIVHIAPRRGQPVLELLAHEPFSFPKNLRDAVLASMDAPRTGTAELARLNWRLGIAYAEAVRSTLEAHPAKLDLVGCHGQTIYHQAKAARYAGRSFPCTWQIGEPALLAAELGVPVVSNFRPADMVTGGQGAPLVPLLDYICLRHHRRTRVLQNIGGIGNLTSIPAGAGMEQVVAFDTGPGNMVIDACMMRLFDRPYDRGGAVAVRGRADSQIVARLLKGPFFSAKPPKTAGREQFGERFVDEFLRSCKSHRLARADIIATATAFTAGSILLALDRFVPRASDHADFVVSGGGAKNEALMQVLRAPLAAREYSLLDSADLGLPPQSKEAAAFALLAYYTWHMRPGNVISATGAKRAALLGSITYA